MKKAKSRRLKQVDGFVLDQNDILRTFVKLKHTVLPTIVVPRKLTSFIILEIHNSKGHQVYQPHSEHDKALLLVG